MLIGEISVELGSVDDVVVLMDGIVDDPANVGTPVGTGVEEVRTSVVPLLVG